MVRVVVCCAGLGAGLFGISAQPAAAQDVIGGQSKLCFAGTFVAALSSDDIRLDHDGRRVTARNRCVTYRVSGARTDPSRKRLTGRVKHVGLVRVSRAGHRVQLRGLDTVFGPRFAGITRVASRARVTFVTAGPAPRRDPFSLTRGMPMLSVARELRLAPGAARYLNATLRTSAFRPRMPAARLAGRYRIGHAVGVSLLPEQVVVESADRLFVTTPGQFALPASGDLSPAGTGTFGLSDLTVSAPASGGRRVRLSGFLALIDPGTVGGRLFGRVGSEVLLIARFEKTPIERTPGGGTFLRMMLTLTPSAAEKIRAGLGLATPPDSSRPFLRLRLVLG